jgi:hypothetical protein
MPAAKRNSTAGGNRRGDAPDAPSSKRVCARETPETAVEPTVAEPDAKVHDISRSFTTLRVTEVVEGKAEVTDFCVSGGFRAML